MCPTTYDGMRVFSIRHILNNTLFLLYWLLVMWLFSWMHVEQKVPLLWSTCNKWWFCAGELFALGLDWKCLIWMIWLLLSLKKEIPHSLMSKVGFLYLWYVFNFTSISKLQASWLLFSCVLEELLFISQIGNTFENNILVIDTFYIWMNHTICKK